MSTSIDMSTPTSRPTPAQLRNAAQRLVRWRKREQISVPQLAKDIGAKRDIVYRLEKRQMATQRTLERIAARMGVPVADLTSSPTDRGPFSVKELTYAGQTRHYLPAMFSQGDFQRMAEALHLKPTRKGGSNPHATTIGSLVLRRLEALYESKDAFLAAIEEEKAIAPVIWSAIDVIRPLPKRRPRPLEKTKG